MSLVVRGIEMTSVDPALAVAGHFVAQFGQGHSCLLGMVLRALLRDIGPLPHCHPVGIVVATPGGRSSSPWLPDARPAPVEAIEKWNPPCGRGT